MYKQEDYHGVAATYQRMFNCSGKLKQQMKMKNDKNNEKNDAPDEQADDKGNKTVDQIKKKYGISMTSVRIHNHAEAH